MQGPSPVGTSEVPGEAVADLVSFSLNIHQPSPIWGEGKTNASIHIARSGSFPMATALLCITGVLAGLIHSRLFMRGNTADDTSESKLLGTLP